MFKRKQRNFYKKLQQQNKKFNRKKFNMVSEQ